MLLNGIVAARLEILGMGGADPRLGWLSIGLSYTMRLLLRDQLSFDTV